MTNATEAPDVGDMLRAMRSGQWPATSAMTLPAIVSVLHKAAWSRVAFSGAMALLSLPILPVLPALGWFAAIAAWEYGLRPTLERLFALPAAARDPAHGFAWLAAINFVGAVGFVVFPFMTWLNGEAYGAVLATAWLCATLNHAFVYFSGSRLVLLACLTPPAVCAIAAPIAHSPTPLTFAAIAALLLMMIAGAVYGFDRQVLMANLARQGRAREAAEQANAAKSQFLASIGNELRTPLTAVIGYAELIEEDAGDTSVKTDAVKIRDAARQVLGVIDIILDVSKLEADALALRRERIELAAVLEHLREAAQPICAANGNSLVVTKDNELSTADIDHMRLHQCALQLVSNAAKFTRDGHIEVRARREAQNSSERFVIEVLDTGHGVPEVDRERIFEAFERGETTRRAEGAGLGLTLVRRLARLMGGDVRCEGRHGGGALFRLWVEV
jgi:nitrogen-specific signal transduction histidine kinase